MSNEIQVWSQILEQINDEKTGRMRSGMVDKVEAILKEIKSDIRAPEMSSLYEFTPQLLKIRNMNVFR